MGFAELLADADAKFFTQCEQSYSQTQTQSSSLNVNRVTRRCRPKVLHSMWTEFLADTDAKLLAQCEQTELLADADAKLLAQCEKSYSQTQMQSYSLNVNRPLGRYMLLLLLLHGGVITRRVLLTNKHWVFCGLETHDVTMYCTCDCYVLNYVVIICVIWLPWIWY